MVNVINYACSQVYEWRLQKMEAFRLEQELATAARLDSEHARMVKEEKEKMQRQQQKAKVAFALHHTIYCYALRGSVLMAVFSVEPSWQIYPRKRTIGVKLHRFLQTRWPSCCPTSIIRALKKTDSTDNNSAIEDGRLRPRVQLKDVETQTYIETYIQTVHTGTLIAILCNSESNLGLCYDVIMHCLLLQPNSVTIITICLYMPHYVRTWCPSQNCKYILYYTVIRGGPSHGHR